MSDGASMMEFDNTDIKRNIIVEPAWYRTRILEVGSPEVSKKGDSFNTTVKAIILRNADNGSEQFADVPIFYMFNTKARGFALGWLEALGHKVESAQRVDLKAGEGMEIEQFIGNRTYEERLQNDPQHKYRAAK